MWGRKSLPKAHLIKRKISERAGEGDKKETSKKEKGAVEGNAM